MKGRIRTIAMFVVVSVALAPYTWIQPTSVSAQSQVFQFNETLPLAAAVANPCQPTDIILLSGDVHVTGHILVTGSGKVQVRAHINTSNLSGESVTTGTQYRLNAVSGSAVTVDRDAFPISASVDLHGILVSQSSTDNLAFRVPVNLQVTGPTTIIPSLGTVTLECRG